MEAAGLSIVMLATGHQTDSFITPGERDELFRHLRELQPIWFPKTPLQEIQDDIISFYSRYRLSALPTYGFVFQMLQDMEDDRGFLTMCYRRTIIDESILTLSSNESALR
mmetsp:Transcript_26235/g.37290  ORF Transcript_26235/g.37290 Transcript_26235/m.37290 type:complete len:110 (+) Transcript_26235:418-747(+)